MTPSRLILLLILPFPLATAWMCGAGLLGFWTVDHWWQWPAVLFGVIANLASAWWLVREFRRA